MQTGDKEQKRTDALIDIAGSSTKIRNPTNNVADPIDPGDTGRGENQQLADKLNKNRDHEKLELLGNTKVNASTKSPDGVKQMIKGTTTNILISKPTKNQIVPPVRQNEMGTKISVKEGIWIQNQQLKTSCMLLDKETCLLDI